MGTTDKPPRRFYVTQFGYIWSLSRDGFSALLASGAAGEGYSLDDPRFNASQLDAMCLTSESGREKAESTLPKRLRHGRAVVIKPLDWRVETFQRAAKALADNDYDTLRYGV